ncbi:hypothetical protein Trydic_g22831 [Trypoxylus dichotomus]
MASESHTHEAPPRVGQINVQNSKAVTAELRKVAQDLRPDVLCIQEPCYCKGAIPGMSGTSRTVTFGERPRAVTIVLNREIAATTMDHLSGPHCVLLELNSILSI